MKFVVNRDQGVTIAEKRYGHSMVVDSDKLLDDPMWDKDPAKKEVQQKEHEVRLKAAKAQFEKAKAEGFLGAEATDVKADTPNLAGKEQ